MEDNEMIEQNFKEAGERYYRPDKSECGEAASAYIAALEAKIGMLLRADAANTMALLAIKPF
jgi:hypothetical protein